MKSKFAPTIRTPLLAGALALAMAGCMTERSPGSANESAGPIGQSNYCATHASEARCAGGRDSMAGSATDSMGRTNRDSMNRDSMADRSGSGTDPYARGGYVPFPAGANESAGIMGQSFFCAQHTSQPGCQTSGWSDGYARGGSRDSRTTGY